MNNFSVSVVIPTYNRKGILEKCLRRLSVQDFPYGDYEIIVVDDGSSDGTGALVSRLSQDLGGIIRYFRQENKGPASARNLGIRQARGTMVFFLGDDIMAEPHLLKEHYGWHMKYPQDNCAVLGRIRWSEDIRPSPFMEWLENGGEQFAYDRIKDAIEVDPEVFFYSSNISLKRQFLLSSGSFFDEAFLKAAYEDLELGYRLKKLGLVLRYNRDALAFHEHYTSLRDACRRMTVVGGYSRLFCEKTGKKPGDFSKTFWREIASWFKFRIFYAIARYYERKSVREDVFRYVMEYCYIRGLRGIRR